MTRPKEFYLPKTSKNIEGWGETKLFMGVFLHMYSPTENIVSSEFWSMSYGMFLSNSKLLFSWCNNCYNWFLHALPVDTVLILTTGIPSLYRPLTIHRVQMYKQFLKTIISNRPYSSPHSRYYLECWFHFLFDNSSPHPTFPFSLVIFTCGYSTTSWYLTCFPRGRGGNTFTTKYERSITNVVISWQLLFFAGLSHEKNLHKMRVLTFMSLGETQSEVKFDDLCKELNIGLDEVEDFVIEGTKNMHY